MNKKSFIDKLVVYSCTCYSLCHYYYEMFEKKLSAGKTIDHLLKNFESINQKIGEFDFTKQKLLWYNEYLSICRSAYDEELGTRLKGEFFSIPDKLLKSQCAQV